MVAFIGIGGEEVLLVLGAALVLFGPKRLPEIARRLGQVSNQLRDANRDLKRELYSNLEPPELRTGPPRPGDTQTALPVPRPATRNIEPIAPAAVPAAAALADYDAPYRDAEAERERAMQAPAAAADAGQADAAEQPAPETKEADPDASGSAS